MPWGMCARHANRAWSGVFGFGLQAGCNGLTRSDSSSSPASLPLLTAPANSITITITITTTIPTTAITTSPHHQTNARLVVLCLSNPSLAATLPPATLPNQAPEMPG
ncbi:hypothetical protein BO71DRAFT_402133 [Aspergillus ellipticus CBS 707.79]|uniref:Uncharacterized protein n=1 Tax=Aspergillus ellipticus CBS 707.79 TaxID=1448320 RepID=A0A319DHA6_9EURO|nr:hypothetical protein BO71DRAFT_402133 [Aspergillus ellipticus CBS 707.79]